MNLQEVGCVGTDWIELAQDRDRWRTWGSIKCWEFLDCLKNRLASPEGLCSME